MTKRRSPKMCMLYPHDLDPNAYIYWHANGDPWPAANRELHYLTDQKRHVIHDFALWTTDPNYAKTFTDPHEAGKWLDEQTAKRGISYGARFSTVAEMIAERYPEPSE